MKSPPATRSGTGETEQASGKDDRDAVGKAEVGGVERGTERRRVPGGLDVPAVAAVLDDGRAWAGKVARRVQVWTGIAPGFERELRAWNPDVVHVHFATDACAFLPVLRKLEKPFVVTLHGYDVGLSDASHERTAEGRRFLRRVAVERGFPERKLWVHRTGIPVREYGSREDTREPLVLFVGRLVEKKGCRVLLETMVRVEREIPQARLVVIGDGPLRSDLERYARANLRRSSLRERKRRWRFGAGWSGQQCWRRRV